MIIHAYEVWTWKEIICNPPYPINVYRESIPSFISFITSTFYFILTTQHESSPLVDSPFPFKSYKMNSYSFKSYKMNSYSQSEP